jgi:drug/metabolite transporter (DMT)-like permease
LPLSVALPVLLAAVLHAGWNAVLKMGDDRLLTITVIIGVGGIIALPFLPFVAFPAAASWPFLLLSAGLHLGYFCFLVKAYRVGDLSHVYPVARGVAPLIVAVGAAGLAGETLAPLGIAGLLCASGGIASLAFLGGKGLGGDGSAAAAARKAFLFALGTGAFIAAYTLADGFGVRRAGSAAGYIAWLFLVSAIGLGALTALLRRGELPSYVARYWRPGLAGGVMCATAYGIVIWALGESPMAFVSALRETSVVIAALIGCLVLKESFGRGRLLAATSVAAGVALLYLAG